MEPNVAHDQHHCVVIHMEERQPLKGPTKDDQEGVHKLVDFGEVEDIGPEEERPRWWGFGWEADDPERVRCVGEDGDQGTNGHDEGEEEEVEVVDGGDGFEAAWFDKWEREVGEEESEGEVGDDS